LPFGFEPNLALTPLDGLVRFFVVVAGIQATGFGVGRLDGRYIYVFEIWLLAIIGNFGLPHGTLG
jgi:hypothetical protein